MAAEGRDEQGWATGAHVEHLVSSGKAWLWLLCVVVSIRSFGHHLNFLFDE